LLIQCHTLDSTDTNADDPEVSKDRHMQIMGHFNPMEFTKSYQSSLVRVDIQGLVLRKQQDKSIDFAKYLRVERGCRPPDGIPYEVQKSIEERVSQAGLGGQAEYNLRRTLKIQARKEFIERWHKENHQVESRTQPSAKIPDSVELLGDLSDSSVQLKVKQRFSSAHRIIMNTYEKTDLSIQERAALLRFLIDLVDDDNERYNYPDELPIRSEISTGTQLHCPVCMKDVTE